MCSSMIWKSSSASSAGMGIRSWTWQLPFGQLRQVGDTSDDAGVGDADDHLLRGEAALAPEPAQCARDGGDVGDLACDDGATRKRDLRHLLQDWPTSTHGELDGPDGVRPDVETDDVTADHEDYLGT
jgi:hypothetical protein